MISLEGALYYRPYPVLCVRWSNALYQEVNIPMVCFGWGIAWNNCRGGDTKSVYVPRAFRRGITYQRVRIASLEGVDNAQRGSGTMLLVDGESEQVFRTQLGRWRMRDLP
jgi:hypothetical protein